MTEGSALLAPSVEAVLARLVCVRPFGLFSDVDGTLSPIAGAPGAAEIHPPCRDALSILVGRLDLVAVVSGRPALDAKRMLDLDGVVYVGNHGLERWEDGILVVPATAAGYQPVVERALNELRARLTLPGLSFEDKGLVAGIHYRLSDRPLVARRAVLRAAAEVASEAGLVVAEGKRVVELRPPVPFDKGTAVGALVMSHRLRAALYLGDDRTDLSAFKALRRLRRAQTADVVAIAVRAAETPAAVIGAADYAVPGVAGVAALLNWLVAATMG